MHGWASGHDLEEVLEDDVSVGDFVRNIRQVIDLLKQVGEASVARELRVNGSAAITLLDRGLVAAAARLQDGEVEEILVKDGESVEFDQELIKIK